MIRNFSDHSANERTFLAWVRTAIAVMAFGFLVKKFDLFLEVAGSLLAGRTLSLPGQKFGKIHLSQYHLSDEVIKDDATLAVSYHVGVGHWQASLTLASPACGGCEGRYNKADCQPCYAPLMRGICFSRKEVKLTL
jgi:hypothetical protein